MRSRFAVTVAAVVLPIALWGPTASAEEATEVASARELARAREAVESTVAQMRATSQRVREQLRTARKRGTRAQIACVDQALSRSDVAVRRARETADDALAAHARGDHPTGLLLVHRLNELRLAQSSAAAEGAQCTPGSVAPATVPNHTTVKLEVDPKIAKPLP